MRRRNSLCPRMPVVVVLLAAAAALPASPRRATAADGPNPRDYDEQAVAALIRQNTAQSVQKAMAEMRRLIARVFGAPRLGCASGA